MFDKLREVLPANRLVALTVLLGALGTQITVLAGTFPEGSEWASGLAMLGSFFAQAVTALTFLRGAQAHEQRQADANDAHRDDLDGAAFLAALEDPEADDVPLEDLPTDAEELAAPPPDAPR